MAKRYFYSCPIKAAYMAKEFGVEYGEDTKINWKSPEAYTNLKGNWTETLKYHISPESEGIFEPKHGDLVCHKDVGYGIVSKVECRLLVKFFSEEFSHPFAHADSSKIIMRDNKHFFQPESEETNDR